MCQIGTQFDSDDHSKEHGATQTSLMPSGISSVEKYPNDIDIDVNTCPLCGIIYGKSISFSEFHEHVLSHFTKEMSIEDFELVH